MAKKKYFQSDVTVQRWIKEGRGAGRGHDYKPWLTVRDVPSRGLSHRVFGHRSQRIHHLLSKLELAVFLILEWQPTTLDIREQFPLQLDATLELAKQHGIAHPPKTGEAQVMTSDFLVDTSHPKIPKFVIQAKYAEELAKPRVIEKLELERRYWQQKGIPWFLVTERDISSTAFRNIECLYPAQRDEIDLSDLIQRIKFYSHYFSEQPNATIVDIAKSFDIAYSQHAGESLREIYQLMAHRFILFDLHKPIQKLTPADLLFANTESMETIQHVQNQ